MQRLLRDRYEPLERLGRGGQGTVMRALDRLHDRSVALKIRPAVGARDELLHEAKVLLDLPPHACLPLVRDDFFDDDSYVVVMDWIEGESLTELLTRKGPFRAHEAIAHLSDVADALDHLHAHGVVHGDVKPSNVIATPAGRDVLVDLGATPGSRLGTPGFRAPEQARGDLLGPAADVYGLGATAFALLTAQRPSGIASWPSVPMAGVLERTIRRALATDPAARYHSAAAFMEDLRGWSSGPQMHPDGEPTTLCALLGPTSGRGSAWPRARDIAIEIAERAITRHGGTVRRERDGLAASFAEVLDAVAAATEMQRVMSRQRWATPDPLTLSIGISLGGSTALPGGMRARRLAEVAHGGQILIGPAAADLAQRSLPPGTTLTDLGTSRLRDLGPPQRIFQVDQPEAPRTFPPLRTLEAIPNNLPITLSTFVGREREIRELRELLEEHRMVTITGAGGSGKTSLALHLAADALDRFPGGIWVLDLAPVTDQATILPWIAAVLGLRVAAGEDVVDTLARSFADLPALVVFDDCEHLVDDIAPIVQRMLETSATTRAIVTGREPLRIPGEAIWRIPSLGPEGEDDADPAVELFIARARAASPSLAITSEARAIIEDICARLDGMPLAIELAATATATTSLSDIRARLDDRFTLLAGGARTALPRQQTLRATMDWSFQALDEQERALLRRMTAFRDGASLEAVDAVCADGDRTMVSVLSRLVDKSLVAAEALLEGSRYRLIQTVADYAAQYLDRDDEATLIRTRHRDFYLSLTERAAPELRGPDQAWWFRALEAEYANIRAAIDWSLAAGDDPVAALRFGAALWRFWWRRHPADGASLLGEMIAREPAEIDPSILAQALVGAGVIETDLGELGRARARCERACAMARAAGDRHVLVTALLALGNVQTDRADQDAARAAYEEALAVARELDWQDAVAGVLGNLGKTAYYQEDYDAAERYLTDSLAIMRTRGDRQAIAVALTGLGSTAKAKGDLAGAHTFHAESLEIYRSLGDQGGIAMALNNLGNLARAEGDLPHARELHEEALTLRTQLGLKQGVVISHLNLMTHTREEGDLTVARAHATQALEIARETGFRTGIPRALSGLGEIARAEGDPAAARVHFRDGLRSAAEIDARDPAAACLLGLASLAADDGEYERALRMAATAKNLGTTFEDAAAREYEETRARASAALDEETAARAEREGSCSTVADAAALFGA